MCETSQGPGWWRASDGKWYPPQPTAVAPPPVPGVPPKKNNNVLVIVLSVLGVLLLLGVGGCVAVVALVGRAVDQGVNDLQDQVDDYGENNAEVVGSNDPGNAGTQADPLPLGTEVDLANGWYVRVNSADLDADAAVAAAAEFNEEPSTGSRYIVVNLTAAFQGNEEGGPEAPGLIESVFGSDGVEHNSYENFATPPDPRFDASAELVQGSEVTGNLVFEVGDDETDLVMRVQPLYLFDSSEAWFSLQE